MHSEVVLVVMSQVRLERTPDLKTIMDLNITSTLEQ